MLQSFLQPEFVVAAVVAALVYFFWRTPRWYTWIAERRRLACAAVFFLTLAIRLAILPWLPVPKPAVHDEFSYLLAADTFAHGRLTNPPHPFWQHFETFHVIQQPTYASKYPPMQGLVLAFGEKVFGSPWAGVCLSAALMCAAICWMLQGWIAPGAALLGALLFMTRVGIFTYWMNSYWGGAVPAIGGALLAGAIPRIARGGFKHSSLNTWIGAAGLAILLCSRPYEGAIFGVTSAAVLLWWLAKNGALSWATLAPIAAPAAVVLAVTAAGLGLLNDRVTGNPLKLPYQVYDSQYSVEPFTMVFNPMPWLKRPAQPVYRHAEMREFYTDFVVRQFRETRSHFVEAFLGKISVINDFFFGFWPVLIFPLIWPYPLKTTEERVTLFLLAIAVLALAPLTYLAPHYAAFAAGLFYLRFMQTMSRLDRWQPSGKRIGVALAAFFVALFFCQFAEYLASLRYGVPDSAFAQARQAVIEKLSKNPGERDLVLVRYAPDHPLAQEWVYNGADIDGSKIVWAHEMGTAEDAPFLAYFRGRKVWLLEPDASPLKLTPLGD